MQQTIDSMLSFRMAAWDNIPDLGLYKDQVITYVEQLYRPLYGEKAARLLTPSMINNYVKMGAISRPTGKKYNREQLAMLSMLVVLKQATAIEDVARLMQSESDGVQDVYESFCEYLSATLGVYARMLAEEDVNALKLAVGASMSALACETMLEESAYSSGASEQKTTGKRRDKA